MSTRITIVYDEKSGVHIYRDTADGMVYLEKESEGLELTVRLMPIADWLALDDGRRPWSVKP